jgi:putative selenate reductase
MAGVRITPFHRLNFLFDVKKGLTPGIGNHVVIIGGGNTAMDAARTAFRLVGKDGKVTIIYRRTTREMPADKGEIRAVKEEGIEIVELTNPEAVISDKGKVRGLQCSKNILAMKGADGRPAPIKVPDSELEISCNTIIPAIGQQLDIIFIDREKLRTVAGSYKTSVERLYIGGDALRGASTAINAIADGRKAAAEIIKDLGLSVSTDKKDISKVNNLNELLKKKALRTPGVRLKESLLSERKNFNLVTEKYSPEEARKEASRCLICDEICNVCVSVCPNLANFSYSISPVHHYLQKAVRYEDGHIGFEPDENFIVSQQYQVLNIRDLCNECGNCDTFCPTSGSPHQQKPGLCLTPQTLNSEHEGYLLSRLPGRDILIYKHNESIKTLTLQDNLYIYETDQVKASINPADFSLVSADLLTPCVKECRFNFAAEMSVIMQGAMQLTR